jgi:hypothetical protein
VFCCLVLPATTGFAQTESAAPAGPPPAHLSLIEGQAYLEREGRSESAIENLPLLEGDRLRTEEGRVEVMLPDGSLLHLDRYTTIDVMAADLLRVLQGRVHVVVRGVRDPGLAARYQFDTPIASVQTGGPGEFRVSAIDGTGGSEVELSVYRGQATLANDLGAQDVRAGERATVREGLSPSVPQYFNSARWDAFDRWSAQRRDERLGTVSVQYLPADLDVYASTFDRYGTWRDDPTDGAVWYPSVGQDWRPYSVGYWRSYPEWDSFWIGTEPWGWPTHHYGRWGFSVGFGWYWMPGRSWSSAWVHWAVSPGYVSWCALGRHDYPVFGHFGLRGSYYGAGMDPWRGWTVVPRQHFGSGMPMHRVAIDGRRLDNAARGAFAVQQHGPATGYAVPRGFAGGGTPARRNGGGFAAGGTPAPRNDRGFAQPGSARPDPAVAARVLRGGPSSDSGTAERRTFPGRSFPTSQGLGAIGRRTDPLAATPDIAVFGNRRNPGIQERAVPGGNALGALDSRAGAREVPGTTRPAGPPLPLQPDAARQRGSRGESGPSAPAVSPRRYDTPSHTPARRTPAFGNGGGMPEGASRPAVPRSYQPPAPAPSRVNPYLRGNSGGMPDSSSRPAAPRSYETPTVAPRTAPYRQSSPAWQGSRQAQPDGPAGRRDSGSGMPAGEAYRPGSLPGGSAPSASPRYNPGAAGSQPRGGVHSAPPRGRGGTPDR